MATSLHFINDCTIDTGGIIANSTLSVQQGKSYLWHVLSLYIGGCQLIEQAIKTLEQGDELTTIVQAGQDHYFTFPSTEQIMAFTQCFGALYEPIEIVDLLGVITEK